MTKPLADPGFFVGYFKKVPPAVRRFVLAVGVFFVFGLAGASAMLALSHVHPGSGGYVDELREGHLTGILDTMPYPILRVPPADGRPARAIMLSGQGKTGVGDPAETLGRQVVDAGGIFVKRGDLDMLLIGGKTGLRLSGSGVPPALDVPLAVGVPPDVPLGRWRLTGEICDGKCYAGAMRPGAGLAHKACANLCISGGVPPVFVTTSPVEGHRFLLLAGPDGGPLPEVFLDQTAVLIELEGRVDRRDDLLIFRVETPVSKVTG